MGYVIFSGNSKFNPQPKPTAKPKKQPKPIAKQSKKMKRNSAEYSFERKIFLEQPENKNCFVIGCKRKANTIEHTKGRGEGFADDWARENDVSLLMDKRFWKPCCLQHNLEFESNAELSKDYQLSKLHEGKKI